MRKRRSAQFQAGSHRRGVVRRAPHESFGAGKSRGTQCLLKMSHFKTSFFVACAKLGAYQCSDSLTKPCTGQLNPRIDSDHATWCRRCAPQTDASTDDSYHQRSQSHWLREQMCAVLFPFSDLTTLLMCFSVISLCDTVILRCSSWKKQSSATAPGFMLT